MNEQNSGNQKPNDNPGRDQAFTEESQASAETNASENSRQEGATDSEQNQAEDQAAGDNSQPAEMAAEEALTRLAEAEDEAGRARDDLLRVQAEMQNLRRRTEADVEKAHKYALERFSLELLAVMDNLERATAAAADSDDPAVKALHDGVDLTLKSLRDVFARFNIEVIDPEGEPFDPQLHQAMSIQENSEVEPDTVIAVMQKGYSLNQRVIRPAMVVVSKAAA